MSEIADNNGFKPVESPRQSGGDGGGTRFTFYDMRKKSAPKKKKVQQGKPVQVILSDEARAYASAQDKTKKDDE